MNPEPFEELRARGNHANNVPAVKAALAELGLCGASIRPPIGQRSAARCANMHRLVGSGIEMPTILKSKRSAAGRLERDVRSQPFNRFHKRVSRFIF